MTKHKDMNKTKPKCKCGGINRDSTKKWRLLEPNETIKVGDWWWDSEHKAWRPTTEVSWGLDVWQRKIRRCTAPTKYGSIKINPPPKPQHPIVRFLKRWLRELTGIYW